MAASTRSSREMVQWIAGDSLLRGEPWMKVGYNPDTRWNDKRKETLDAIKKLLYGASVFFGKILCKYLGHAWDKNLFSRYEPSGSLWERQLQAVKYGEQYCRRCMRPECVAQKPRE